MTVQSKLNMLMNLPLNGSPLRYLSKQKLGLTEKRMKHNKTKTNHKTYLSKEKFQIIMHHLILTDKKNIYQPVKSAHVTY